VCILATLKKYLQEYESITDLLKQGADVKKCIGIIKEVIENKNTIDFS